MNMKKLVLLVVCLLFYAPSQAAQNPRYVDQKKVSVTGNTYTGYTQVSFSTGIDAVVGKLDDTTNIVDAATKLYWCTSDTPNTHTAIAHSVDPSVPDNYFFYINQNEGNALSLYLHIPGANTTTADVLLDGWRLP